VLAADTSALVSLATADTLDLLLVEFDVHTTTVVSTELEATAAHDDASGAGATRVLERQDRLTVHDIDRAAVPTSSRVDTGEGSCCLVSDRLEADFLLTDDLRALPELERLTDARVAISPIVSRALVERGALDRAEATARLETLAEARDWLGAPIYRRARRLFD
jgi:predicted nucleic acid-binding protein